MAALEHSSWQIVDLAGSPVRRNATGWIGHAAARHHCLFAKQIAAIRIGWPSGS